MSRNKYRALALGLAISFLISSAAFVSASAFAEEQEQIFLGFSDVYENAYKYGSK